MGTSKHSHPLTYSHSLLLYTALFTLYRNGFNCFSYFVFLYNGIVGFVAAIVRVLLALLFGTLLLFRLDQNIMMENFKFADLGRSMVEL